MLGNKVSMSLFAALIAMSDMQPVLAENQVTKTTGEKSGLKQKAEAEYYDCLYAQVDQAKRAQQSREEAWKGLEISCPEQLDKFRQTTKDFFREWKPGSPDRTDGFAQVSIFMVRDQAFTKFYDREPRY
ncbi:hypothetical protein JQ628_12905 [Bradyrhizobium lablabi]|uniref:hypothetical protein n=1 Tax=Bradyrhizobium lablabi TaxID=722472 RepID=UPI001BA86925|nr:hypothetical protein [Bradyrhizobium lablabi]MBR1122418.1 hypothetical protein [Bradyrhizobium lablabi]